jgi:hypothetical protein
MGLRPWDFDLWVFNQAKPQDPGSSPKIKAATAQTTPCLSSWKIIPARAKILRG